jgi:hypothetical protein
VLGQLQARTHERGGGIKHCRAVGLYRDTELGCGRGGGHPGVDHQSRNSLSPKQDNVRNSSQ